MPNTTLMTNIFHYGKAISGRRGHCPVCEDRGAYTYIDAFYRQRRGDCSAINSVHGYSRIYGDVDNDHSRVKRNDKPGQWLKWKI